MTGAMMMDRSSLMGMPGMAGMGAGMVPGTAMPAGGMMMMAPRCTVKMEKVSGGMKMACVCDDPMGCSMMQHLCSMLAGGMCSCCMMMNGLTVCCCNLMMGMCKCEMTEKGCTITCTSGDAKCCEMIQACCDCMAAMLKAGCTCCVLMNNTPVACGC
jgi:hypothetical protein